ncbi:DHH family phosphoesterase [Candidatus Woesearchaeota archaeon]|nr:DHH family phosphoesterase [Candidatus Woesearchaeota archaeon]
MVLNKEQLEQIKDELDSCKRPLFFFDDDPDGFCSFLLLYRYKREGKGIPVKTAPKINENFARKVDEFEPDKVFVLDVPIVEQDFLDAVKVPVIWVDHHGPLKRHKVKYFNPRLNDITDDSSVTENCYYVVKQDLWIAMTGSVGDWDMPSFADEFKEKYPKMLDKEVNRPEVALFDSRLGKLVKILSFILKGKISDVIKCIKVMTRIEEPEEILKQLTPKGKFIYRRYQSINERYKELLDEIMNKKHGEILLYTYKDAKFSFTKELSNELLFNYPKKIIIIGRERSGEVKLSFRSKHFILPPLIKKALKGVDGYGGGHEHACGAAVKEEDFEKFIKQFKESLKK